MSGRRDDSGQFTGRIDDEDVLRALRAHPDPVATAGDLADDLGVTSETVRRHLSSLQKRGLVARKDVGARAVVWWPVEADTAPAAPLRDLVGMLGPDEADRARKRSEEWRAAFDDELDDAEDI